MNNDSQWDQFAEEYAESVGEEGDLYHKNYLNPVVDELLGEVEGTKILDLACGNGYYSRKLAKLGAKVVGVDASPLLLNKAKDEEEANPLGIKYIQSSATNIEGVSQDEFDTVICNVSLHDIENIKGTFEEVARVLKGDGRFIFSLPHPCFFSGTREKDDQGYYQSIRFYLKERQYRREAFGNTLFYHRPLSVYVNLLSQNSIYIKGMHEIATFKHYKGKLLEDNNELSEFKKEIPSFIIFETKIK